MIPKNQFDCDIWTLKDVVAKLMDRVPRMIVYVVESNTANHTLNPKSTYKQIISNLKVKLNKLGMIKRCRRRMKLKLLRL